MLRRISFALILALVVPALLLAPACSGPAPGASTEVAPAAAEDQGSGDGDFVPAVALPDLDGNTVDLAQYDGTVRLIDFWTTWCAPCREEIPMFKELHETYADQGFTLVAVSMDSEGSKVVRPFVEEYGITYLNLIGTEEADREFGGIVGYPTAFLVDRDGRIIETYVGPKPRRVLERKIRELLGLEAA